MRLYVVFCVVLLFSGTMRVFSEEVKPIVSSESVFEKANDDMRPLNQIDKLVAKELAKRGLNPSRLSSDAVFLRRVWLVLLGTIPRQDEVNAFLRDQSSDKRSKMIDRLLEEDRFHDYQAMKWSDLLCIKSEFPINLWPNGASTYHRWVRNALRENMPYDEFARSLLTASGSNFRSGPANFYRAVQIRNAESYAESVGSVFLGMTTDLLSEGDRKNFSKFFSRVSIKGSAQWKEEIVYWNRKPLENQSVVFPDGSRGKVESHQDPRGVFADWLVKESNHRFRYCVVNRIWKWLYGKELTDTSADMMEGENCPAIPGLLEYLASELLDSGYDLKHVYRLILNSRTWQQSSLQKEYGAEAQKYFAVYPIRRIDAEVLQDIFIQIFNLQVTYVSETPEPYSYIPTRMETVQLSDAGITNSFLEMFGRSTRDTGTETDRNNDVTASQELFFINSNEINMWSRRPANRFRQKRKTSGIEPWEITNLWLSIVSRPPTASEKDYVIRGFLQAKGKSAFIEDVAWSLLNSKEFLCVH